MKKTVKKVAAAALRIVAWVAVVLVGAFGAYAALMDLVHYHPAWQWPMVEASFIIVSLAGASFLLGRKVIGFALVSVWLIIFDVALFSVWNQGALFNNTLAIIVALAAVGYAFIGFNEYRYS